MENWLILRRKFHEHAYVYMDIHIHTYTLYLLWQVIVERGSQIEADVDLR